MKIGVELRLDRDGGELVADARALEAAGADSFWAADPGEETVVLAAVAAVTWRARVISVGTLDPVAAQALARLSRGRIAAATREGQAYLLSASEGEPERWLRAAFPESRAAWRELKTAREAEGVAGLILPNDARLMDLVRNPDVEDDRSDLKLAFG